MAARTYTSPVGFDEILREWEAGRRAEREAQGDAKGKARSDAGRRTGRGSSAARSLAQWLERHPPKEQAGREKGYVSPQAERAERAAELRRMKPQAALDLHGLRAEQVIPALERFVSASRRAGLRKVLIIHGKGKHSQGEPVLQRLVRAYLERSLHTGAFGPADRAMGGSGATWAALREPKKP